MEKINAEDLRHIAGLMEEGFTSGFFNREGYRVTWRFDEEESLIVNIFKY